MGLFYPNDLESYLMGYADVDYLSNPHNGLSQTRYLFNVVAQRFHSDL